VSLLCTSEGYSFSFTLKLGNSSPKRCLEPSPWPFSHLAGHRISGVVVFSSEVVLEELETSVLCKEDREYEKR
jgi:hypothetical protein